MVNKVTVVDFREAIAPLDPPLQLGKRRLFHNNIIGIFWFITIESKQIFYSLLYYFCGQHYC